MRLYHESIKKDEEEYDNLYGELPSSKDELIQYLLNMYNLTIDDMKKDIESIQNIKWVTRQFTLFIKPYGTPRPRQKKNGGMYVRGAKKHKKIIEKYVQNENIIHTRTQFQVCVYSPTPKSVSIRERILFEMGCLRPLTNPDWDNLGKTYSDMVQGILLMNDNIISDGCVSKFYSIKPRVEIYISHQEKFDCKYNERKIKKSTLYRKLVEERGT